MAKKRVTKKAPKPKTDARNVQIPAEDLPRRTLKDALAVPRVLHDTYAGKGASWEEIAGALGVAHSNPHNKYPLWAAVAYGVVKKEDAGTFALAEKGRKILAPNYEGEDQEAIVQAIQVPTILGRFYADYNGSPVPPDEHLLNVLENRYGIPRNRRQEAAELILDNARFAGVLAENGDRRSIALTGTPTVVFHNGSEHTEGEESSPEPKNIEYSKICFLITPIGSDESEERKHADLVLKHLVAPVLAEAGLEPVRADKIGKPGLITQQIIEHLARARLCIADLSFNNPNAFYEIGVRHTFRLPTIQVIRRKDPIPFDVAQGRTVIVDTSDVYTIMDKFASARAELEEHVSAALATPQGDSRDNPISYYLPGLTVSLPA